MFGTTGRFMAEWIPRGLKARGEWPPPPLTGSDATFPSELKLLLSTAHFYVYNNERSAGVNLLHPGGELERPISIYFALI